LLLQKYCLESFSSLIHPSAALFFPPSSLEIHLC